MGLRTTQRTYAEGQQKARCISLWAVTRIPVSLYKDQWLNLPNLLAIADNSYAFIN